MIGKFDGKFRGLPRINGILLLNFQIGIFYSFLITKRRNLKGANLKKWKIKMGEKGAKLPAPEKTPYRKNNKRKS
jgi:hypothetical protein